jgi:large subunit ribosomal protein L9
MAKAILTQDVDTLGERGAVVDVSPGYLRNFLIPRKLAEPATDARIAEAQRRQEAAERAAREQAERAQENAALLACTVLTKRRVRLEQPIRTTGSHMVTVEVHDGVTADVKTIVTPQ